jgi:hypothetical protein
VELHGTYDFREGAADEAVNEDSTVNAESHMKRSDPVVVGGAENLPSASPIRGGDFKQFGAGHRFLRLPQLSFDAVRPEKRFKVAKSVEDPASCPAIRWTTLLAPPGPKGGD